MDRKHATTNNWNSTYFLVSLGGAFHNIAPPDSSKSEDSCGNLISNTLCEISTWITSNLMAIRFLNS